ncbi:MAG: aminoacetone oxidase family FAD-binding enzyme [Syntrophomonadaceae bacterium]|jgi:hypothetical protein
MKIAVIGAGAAGIMAALSLARVDAQVTLFEQNPRIGKKILVTGSGRCNLSNESVCAEAYHCADTEWMGIFLENYGIPELKDCFEKLGIPLIKTDDGWYYPLSQSAQSVVAILEERLLESAVKLRVATKAEWFSQDEGGFKLKLNQNSEQYTQYFDRLIVAAGGKASPNLGSKGELFPALQAIGHQVLPKEPALGPIYVDLQEFKQLKGQRFNAICSLYADGERLHSTFGNLIITDKGFNGPGVMNLSHLVALNPDKQLELQVNFLGPYWEGMAEQFVDPIKARRSLRGLLLHAFTPKASAFFLEQAKIQSQTAIDKLDEAQLTNLLRVATNNRFNVTGAGDFTNSQVSVGGVPVSEVDPHSCQSLLIPGLYLVGETNDVIGPCGGFNLHYAFGSGFLAGKHLASEIIS